MRCWPIPGQSRRSGYANGPFRNIVHCWEPAFAHLLASAIFIKLNHEVRICCVEIGRRIVKGEVAVFANSDKGNINRMPADFLFQTNNLLIGVYRTIYINKLPGRNNIYKTLLQVFTKRCRMRIANSNVFVEMKGGNFRPVNFFFHEFAKHFKL